VHAGVVTNTAKATGVDPQGTPVASPPLTVTLPEPAPAFEPNGIPSAASPLMATRRFSDVKVGSRIRRESRCTNPAGDSEAYSRLARENVYGRN
jgi:hypothetical protein